MRHPPLAHPPRRTQQKKPSLDRVISHGLHGFSPIRKNYFLIRVIRVHLWLIFWGKVRTETVADASSIEPKVEPVALFGSNPD
jgi:hypothetical protein